MLIQTNPRFQSVRASLGLIMLVSTLAILLPQVNVVKRADTTNPSLRGVRKVGVGPAGIVPALGVDGMYGNDGSEPWTSSQVQQRSEEHTSELQSRGHLVCRLLLEKKK